MKTTPAFIARVLAACILSLPYTASANGPLLDAADSVHSFETTVPTTRMNVASDGESFYMASGGFPSGIRLEKRDRDGNFVRNNQVQIDVRSVLYDPNTNRLLVTSYNPGANNANNGIFSIDRDTLQRTKLYNATLAGSQSMPSLDPSGQFFYCLVPGGGGVVRSYRVSNGELVGDVVTLRLQNARAEAGSIARTDYVGGMFITWDNQQKYFRAYDAQTGNFLGQSHAASVGNARNWMSYADGLAWVFDQSAQRWRGFQILAGPAPEVNIEGGDSFEFDEGGALTLTAIGTEGVTFSWDLDGDGELDDAVGPDATIQVLDGPAEFTVTVEARTDIGRTSRDSVTVTVQNLPPRIDELTATPDAVEAYEEVQFTAIGSDPAGDLDFLTYRWNFGDGEATTGADTAHIYTTSGSYTISVTVLDGDGGSANDSLTIEVLPFSDADNDGAPDACERRYGLDPQDPEDAEADNDMDGINNRDECLTGTDPTVFNGPTAPAIHRPSDGSEIRDRRPGLAVSNAEDPDGDDLSYEFELYEDEALTTLVASVSDLEQGFRLTVWTREEALAENGTYWWRARASDPFVAGPWTDTVWFFVNSINEAPEAPEPIGPEGTVTTTRPTLEARPAVDPEDDDVTYTWEIIADTDDPEVVTSGESDGPTWTPREELLEDHRYYWRCVAHDSGGERSPRSRPAYFTVNTANVLPGTATWVSPSEGEVVDQTPVSLVFNAVIDTDNDDVTYELEVAISEDFAAPLLTVEGFSGEEDQIAVELEDPEEDAQHWARVRAWDAEGAGPWAVVSFFVDAINSPPTTVALTSPEDGARLLPGPIDFAWEPATDPEGGALTYTINLFGDAGLSALVWSRGAVDATSETWEAPAEAQTYFWTVTAADDQGLEGPSGGPGEFTVALMANQGPGAPTPRSPVDDAVVDPAGVILVAAAATDPEEDTLSYEFEVFSDDGLADRVFLEGGITGQGDSAYATVSGLPEEAARYWWRVRAGDQEVLGPWSNTATFLTGALDSEDPDDEDPMGEEEAPASTGDGGCATAPGHPTWIALLALGAFLFRRRR